MRLIAAFATALLWTGHAYSQNISASAPESLAEEIRSIGYRAELFKGNDSDPFIISSADGESYGIFFYGCKENKNCQSIMFYREYSEIKSKYPEIKQISDAWNSEIKISKTSLDDDKLYHTYLVIMSDEGMPRGLFKKNFLLWIEEYNLLRKRLLKVYEDD